MQNRLRTLSAACVPALCVWLFLNAATARLARADEPAAVSVVLAHVTREPVAQQVHAYGVVASAAANADTVSLPYIARIRSLRVQPGQRVARGAPLAVVQADPSAVVALTQAQGAQTLARGELARTESLYRDGLATQSQLASAQKALSDAQQALAAQRALGVSAGAITIAAPVGGVVAQLTAAPGDQLQAGAPILQLIATNANAGANANASAGADHVANVTLGVEPADAMSIHDGDRIALHALATGLDKATANGSIVMVGASVDTQSQLVNVGASVPLAGTSFIPGTHVRADIETKRGDWWVVPRSAVLRDDHGAYVFQVAPDEKAHRVAVSIRVENDRSYGVDGALDAARPLVITGNYELTDGMAVRATKGTAP
ncbi:efflux RND transporter periplasmic adaptor subunit [Paraburkholderia edwinii]|uniref:Efflux RND transporter periplasmic adaptor subunit n=1 Tax=Paraburkholderia edwinii TaxID=2861782 RepID=A0ABX8UH46_9BURK|nr:efflux RND transporter periplasmic adaptor subunit [Paraburkholderia edwinii]QYD68241.1 efflux RND transporter periplasmic adaptor subunit [Paraburkholderia edwinii]